MGIGIIIHESNEFSYNFRPASDFMIIIKAYVDAKTKQIKVSFTNDQI